jgi:HlyD family secretion protein
MDVKREGVARRKRIKGILVSLVLLGTLALAGWRISLLKPAAPSVEASSIWPDTVKRGTMLLEVRGLGTLVPEDILWIQAQFDSQVSKVSTQSGDEVKPDSVLLVLSNPQMEADANDYEWQTKQAEASYLDLKVRLQSQTFDQEAAVASTDSDLEQAAINKDKEEQLFKAGIEPEINVKLAAAKWKQTQSKYTAEKQKLAIQKDSVTAQLESQKVQIDKLRATYQLKKKQVDELTIHAGIPGRVQEMTLQVGQRVKPGDVLAKVAQPWKLMARLQIAETQAKDIMLGQHAVIDTRNGTIGGHVSRIDSSIVNGTRTVDCKLEGKLPSGAVPDLSVDGTIQIANLTNVLYVGRPVFGPSDSSASIFKIDADGQGAERVTVKFGRASPNTIELLDGLKVGDRVILSDMSAQDRYSRIRLN